MKIINVKKMMNCLVWAKYAIANENGRIPKDYNGNEYLFTSKKDAEYALNKYNWEMIEKGQR